MSYTEWVLCDVQARNRLRWTQPQRPKARGETTALDTHHPPPPPPPHRGGVYIWWGPLTIMVCTMTESAPLSKSERLIWAIMTPNAKRRYLFVGGPLDGQRRKICPLERSYKCHGHGRSTWTYTRTKIFDDYNAAIVYATPGVAYDAVAAFVLRREPLDTSKEYERWLLRK